MVDIQSPTAEIRRGKKKEEERRRKKPQGKNIMACPIPEGGHNYRIPLSMFSTTVLSATSLNRHYWKFST